MFKEAVYHSMDSNYAYPINLNTIVIRLRVKKGDIKKVTLFYGDRCYESNPVKMKSIKMEISQSDKLFDYFEIEFETLWRRICYYFYLEDGIETTYFYNDDFFSYVDENRTKYYQYAYIRQEDIAQVPEWVQDAIIYQIFPDSFASDKNKISEKSKEIEIRNGINVRSLRGGTINGINMNISYLKKLGINCIYLNPIFIADSYHKYDIIDYYDIDPCFGTKEDFKILVQNCHEVGIKIILDGVFNHTSVNFFAFEDVVKNGEKSRYKDWYMIHSFPVKKVNPPNYECFCYVKEMPRTNTANIEVIEYFNGVAKYWIEEFGIDGFRLDVANEIDHNFWRLFRQTVKRANKDAVIIAEIWEDCSSFLNGDQFDSAMNYNFTYACEDFFAKGEMSASIFDERLGALRARYKKPMLKSMMNLLDSHDVKRFLFTCEEDIRKLKLASLFQLTYEGVPSVYYGDEIGISGNTDDGIRHAMNWEKEGQNEDLLNHYRTLIKIRTSNKALSRGTVKTEIVDDENSIYAYSRSYNNEKIIVIINNSNKAKTVVLKTEDGLYHELYKGDIFHGVGGEVKFVLEPYEGKIMKK